MGKDKMNLPDYLQEYLEKEIKWENNASTRLISHCHEHHNYLLVEDESEFPDIKENEFFLVTLEHPLTRKVEIALCYKKEKNKLWVKRGYEGTKPLSFPPGTLCENRITKGTLELLYIKSILSGENNLPSFYPTFLGSPGQFLRVNEEGNSLEYFSLSFTYTYYLNKIYSEDDLDNLKNEFFIRHNLGTRDILYNLYDLGKEPDLDSYINIEKINSLNAVIPEDFKILNNNTIYIKTNPFLINGILKLFVDPFKRSANKEKIEFVSCELEDDFYKIKFKNSGNDIGGIRLDNVIVISQSSGDKEKINFNTSYILILENEEKIINIDKKFTNYDIIFMDLSGKTFQVSVNE